MNPQDLLSNLSLTKNNEKLKATITPFKSESGVESDTHFMVTSKIPFFYSTDYRVAIKKGLKPKYGTEPLALDYSITTRGADFLSNSQVFRRIYDASGTLTDTREYTKDDVFIPSENVLFRQTFLSEVPLDKNLFMLKTASGKTVDFDIFYVKQPKQDGHGNTV